MDDETLEVPAKKQFEGFRKPDKNFYHMPNEWTDIMAEIDNLAELKVVEYIMRHTWGFKEYDQFKTITVDEFLHGRISNGERMDKGTGLKSDRSVKDGLKAAIEHGYVLCDVDAKDKARIKKSYKLKMRQVDTTSQTGNNYPSEGQNLPLGNANSTPRSEKETLARNLQKNTGERKNGAAQQKPSSTPETPIHSSTPSSFSSVEFTEEENLVHELAKKKKLSFLGMNERNKKHCSKLVKEGIATLEQIESLMQFCWQRPYLAGKDLNLGNFG